MPLRGFLFHLLGVELSVSTVDWQFFTNRKLWLASVFQELGVSENFRLIGNISAQSYSNSNHPVHTIPSGVLAEGLELGFRPRSTDQESDKELANRLPKADS